ncbi:MAG: efflux RND transporter periplasmic adaptor subunit [Acidobacteriota bacterium]|nr:efflux RND transporter periplasmic adaptor subunit [Acidobacteriota bacterium]
MGSAEEKVTLQRSTSGLHAASDKAKIASQTRLRDQARDEVTLIREHLALMDVKTPTCGVISYFPNYTQGWMNAQPYKVGDHAYPGAVIAEVPDLSTLQMESKLDETDRGRVSKGDSVLVHVDALPEKVFNAQLTSISPLTEQSFNEWPRTRSFRGYALIGKSDSRMRPGMNAAADIVEKKTANAVSVPAKALFTRHGQPTVYVATGDHYVPTSVRVRARNPDEVAVEGLAPGARISLAEPAQETK